MQKKKLVDKLVDDYPETVEEVKLTKITITGDESSYKCSLWRVYIVLFYIIFTINVGIVTYYVYSQCYTKKDAQHIEFNTLTQTMIY